MQKLPLKRPADLKTFVTLNALIAILQGLGGSLCDGDDLFGPMGTAIADARVCAFVYLVCISSHRSTLFVSPDNTVFQKTNLFFTWTNRSDFSAIRFSSRHPLQLAQ